MHGTTYLEVCTQMAKSAYEALPGVLGSSGESLFYFQGAGRNSNYFKGAREQAFYLRELGSTVKNVDGLASGGQSPRDPP